MAVFTINLPDRYFRDFMQLADQKRWNEPIHNCTHQLHWKASRPFIYEYSLLCSKFRERQCKEPKYLNVYQIISRRGNVGMEGDFFINILADDF